MKKYTIRVNEVDTREIEEAYNVERQWNVNQGLPVGSMNSFLSYCVKLGIKQHLVQLKDNNNGNAKAPYKTALETMNELLSEVG